MTNNRFDNEGSGGGIFVLGLVAGTVIGAGLGLLFAPKSGSDLRRHISEQAGNLANTASEGYKRVAGAAGEWADKGRESYGKAREVVSRGVDEAERFARETTSAVTGSLRS